MKIAGFLKTSLIDYPGNVAAVVFTQGCNFRCSFCHNPDLLPLETGLGLVSEEEVLRFLQKRKNILDGVVITGGEPTLQKDLVDFLKTLKKMGYLIKLDTNGTNPKVLERLLKENLLDFIAMDIKASKDNYEEICGPVNFENIQKSIKMIMVSNIQYEFRTTVLPKYHSKEDLMKLGGMIKGAKRYVIQGFRPDITYDKTLKSEKSFKARELQNLKKLMEEYVNNVEVYENSS